MAVLCNNTKPSTYEKHSLFTKKRMDRETFCNSYTYLVTDESEMNTNALFTDVFFTG
uniref:Uncharacterized protein n=1 Tax=Anguilla anguilla TaxID=7936 RepID=A0A0E9VMB8_ANGAN